MSKIEQIRSEMVAAMKAKDKERKDALSMLLGSLKNKAIDKRSDLTEAEENEIVLKEIKQLKETLDSAPADRTDIIEQCQFRIRVYEEFAPKFMTNEEIKATLQQVLDRLELTAPTAKDKGKIMKELMPLVKGKSDGKVVNQLVSELFQ
ncbi:GatB/YqeY domain-containing protein [Frisingicoccus sp.]|uniref:GatB/YqeY domain-containing protein n=1 Tax=Frisingicoccus sp. TaxID=1918627 RepID=UPI0026106735|nr:GatB/YqeY domain-containing protein [Frisingicoccus sp.]MDD6233192.1 GatB/YqeY domain-containing protein [Frisingicoccus sp.]MDY4834079.1 GatB/YqeY domain-containing protein [Frisingicoccus sp.]MDY4923141.1 GatB/YqeY domain-containing protein [Frisingicoccus sp.]